MPRTLLLNSLLELYKFVLIHPFYKLIGQIRVFWSLDELLNVSQIIFVVEETRVIWAQTGFTAFWEAIRGLGG